MNIAFLTTLNPADINNWSGTTFHLFHALSRKHHVKVIGQNTPCYIFAESFKQNEWQTDNLYFFNHLNFNDYGFRVCSNKKSVRF